MLKGKTALVTGSTSGIGLGIAHALAQQGANIVLNGFGDSDGPKAAVAAHGVQVAYHSADMSKPAEIADMMAFLASDRSGYTTGVIVTSSGSSGSSSDGTSTGSGGPSRAGRKRHTARAPPMHSSPHPGTGHSHLGPPR